LPVGPTVDVHQTVETNSHSAEQSARFTAPGRSPQHPLPRCEQRGSNRFALVSFNFSPVEEKSHRAAPLNVFLATQAMRAFSGKNRSTEQLQMQPVTKIL
jgi:hypothetical protein